MLQVVHFSFFAAWVLRMLRLYLVQLHFKFQSLRPLLTWIDFVCVHRWARVSCMCVFVTDMIRPAASRDSSPGADVSSCYTAVWISVTDIIIAENSQLLFVHVDMLCLFGLITWRRKGRRLKFRGPLLSDLILLCLVSTLHMWTWLFVQRGAVWHCPLTAGLVVLKNSSATCYFQWFMLHNCSLSLWWGKRKQLRHTCRLYLNRTRMCITIYNNSPTSTHEV